MVTELVTFKIEKNFLKDVDKTVKESNFQNRTEFIRASLRDGINQIKLKKTMEELSHLKGAAKKKTTPEEYERAREFAFEEISKQFK